MSIPTVLEKILARKADALLLSKRALTLDGDLLVPGAALNQPGLTETAVRSLAGSWAMAVRGGTPVTCGSTSLTSAPSGVPVARNTTTKRCSDSL